MKTRILLIDDGRDIAEACEHFLSDWGYDVTIAIGIPQAIYLLEANDFDIVLTDIWLDMSPKCLVPTIRKLRPDAKIILLSSESPESIERYRVEWGADGGAERYGIEQFEELDRLIRNLLPTEKI